MSTVEAVPIDAADLAGYAGRLFDETQKHPQALRLAAWFALERGGAARPPAVTASNAAKESAIAQAQRAGLVSTRFPPGELLALVVGLSVLGSAEFAPTGFTDDSREERRRTVVEAVGLLSRP